MGKTQEVFIESYDMTDYLVDNEFELLYELEYGQQFEFTGSSINLEFNENSVMDDLRWSFGDANDFFGVIIYLDGNESPEFWGIINKGTLEYDTDNHGWVFTAVDATDYYRAIWRTRNMPSVGSPSAGIVTLEDMLNLFIYNTLFSGLNINVGDMNTNLLMGYYRLHIQGTVTAEKYFITNYLDELQKHYGSYIYATADKKLNFINRAKYNATIHHISNNVMNILESGYEPTPYKAIGVSLWLQNAIDPDADVNNDGNYLILPNGKAKYVNMVVENSVALGDWDRDLNYSYPAYRFNHLDLRNSMPATSGFDPFEMLKWNPVAYDTVANRYSAYKNILNSAKVMTVIVDGYNYNLLDQAYLDDSSTPNTRYIIMSIKKNLKNETSVLKLREDLT
jgi:hypothetical protein